MEDSYFEQMSQDTASVDTEYLKNLLARMVERQRRLNALAYNVIGGRKPGRFVRNVDGVCYTALLLSIDHLD